DLLLALVGPDHLAAAVEHLEADRALRLGERVIEDGAGGRVLPLERAAAAAAPEAQGGARNEQVSVGLLNPVVPLAQRTDVVEDPEGAAVGGDDEVVALHDQVADGDGREVELEGLPARAVVEGDEHAGLGPRVEQALAPGILAD